MEIVNEMRIASRLCRFNRFDNPFLLQYMDELAHAPVMLFGRELERDCVWVRKCPRGLRWRWFLHRLPPLLTDCLLRSLLSRLNNAGRGRFNFECCIQLRSPTAEALQLNSGGIGRPACLYRPSWFHGESITGIDITSN